MADGFSNAIFVLKECKLTGKPRICGYTLRMFDSNIKALVQPTLKLSVTHSIIFLDCPLPMLILVGETRKVRRRQETSMHHLGSRFSKKKTSDLSVLCLVPYNKRKQGPDRRIKKAKTLNDIMYCIIFNKATSPPSPPPPKYQEI